MGQGDGTRGRFFRPTLPTINPGFRAIIPVGKWDNRTVPLSHDDPRASGKPLTANRKGQWRYRIGDYRLICAIEDDRLIIVALSVGHRSIVYKAVTNPPIL